jgi:hypothetical protein
MFFEIRSSSIEIVRDSSHQRTSGPVACTITRSFVIKSFTKYHVCIIAIYEATAFVIGKMCMDVEMRNDCEVKLIDKPRGRAKEARQSHADDWY